MRYYSCDVPRSKRTVTKRTIGGPYVSVEPFHLFRCLDEQEFRYNNRATKDNPIDDGDRFQFVLANVAGWTMGLASSGATEITLLSRF
jgi:hypothetical protein